jgi:hypothetical protein
MQKKLEYNTPLVVVLFLLFVRRLLLENDRPTKNRATQSR